MDENVNVYEVFGLEPPAEEPAPEGAQEQEVADPAEDLGVQEQEIADPDTDADGEEPAAELGEEPDKKPLTKEQRAENAKRRRQEELQTEVEKALQKEREAQSKQLQSFFARAKLKNPYTGKEITSLEEFEQFDQRSRMEAAQKDLKAGKLTPEAMEQLIESTPTMKKAREQLEQAERTAQQTANERHAQRLEQELAEIRKLNPKVQSLSDIIRMPTGQRFAELVQKNGLSYVDAYHLANLDALREQERRAASTSERMRNDSKSHLQPVSAKGQGAVEVPRDVLQNYREMFPEKTDEEIRKMYEKRVR